MEIASKPRDQVTEEDVQFLRENYTSMGGLLPKGFNGGAFFTPTHVAKFVWDVLKARLPESPRILEPSVGSGVFLEHAPTDADITALELDETSAKVTSLIYPHVNVIQGNAILHERANYYDLVIGNPPYGETIVIDEADGDFSEWKTLTKRKGQYRGKSEAVFIEHAIRNVKPGGYVAFILPMGVSFNTQTRKARELLFDTCWQVATVMLPGETFEHVGTTIPTQLIIVRKATPNARKIKPATKRWGSNFRRSDWAAIDGYNAEFFEGQTPAYFAKITDVSDATQLDEIAEDFNDNDLMRENLYPHLPSWHGLEKGNEAFFFSHGNDSCDGYRDASRTFADGPYRWNELTLGAGEEVEWRGELRSTFDFGWQDEIVSEWEASENGRN